MSSAAVRRAAPLALVPALLLGACSSAAPEATAPPPPVCPSALILQGAERTAEYTSDSNAPSALEHLAVMTNLGSACRFDDTGVDVDLAFDLIAERGPAMTGDTVALTYFVATLAADGRVLAKELLSSDIAFEDQERVAGVAEELTYRLPQVTAGQGQDYLIYLGFQLDQAELDQRLQPLLR